MRFCLVTTQLQSGGGEFLLASLAGELQQAGHAVGWIARENSHVVRALSETDQHVLYKMHGRGKSLRDVLQVRRCLAEWKADVVIMNDTHAVVLAGLGSLLLGKKRPVRLAYKHTVFPLRSSLKYRFLTDKVICVSKAARQTIIEGGLAAEHSATIYGGILPPSREMTHAERVQVRSDLGIHGDTQLILSVGNLLPVKGHLDLVKAIQLLKPARKFKLVIAGEGSERGKLEEAIHSLGLAEKIQLLGFRRDAEQLLAACDLVVHPSQAEGLSLVLIQAQMLMKPIVATAVGGASEVLESGCQSDNNATWIARASDPQDLATQIHSALAAVRDPGNRQVLHDSLGRAALRARRNFSLPENSKQLVEVASLLRHEQTRRAA